MSAPTKLRAAEDGFVMVTVTIVMMITLVIGGVVLSDTVTARRFTTHDGHVAKAQHAADAGLQAALSRANQANMAKTAFNSGLSGLSHTLLCTVATYDASGQVSGLADVTYGVSQGPCPTQPSGGPPVWNVEPFGNHTSYATQFIPGGQGSATAGHATLRPVIVSIGRDDMGTPADTSDDVVRRVEALLNPVDPFSAIEATNDVTISALLGTVLNGDIRANHNVTATGAALLAGNLLAADGSLVEPSLVLYGNQVSLPLLSTAATRQQANTVQRTPVSISSTKRDCYDNTGIQGAAGPCPTSAFYTVANHRLSVASGTLTLGGGDYVFCSVSISSGATLQTSTNAATPTRIFIDSPSSSRCANTSATGNLTISGNLNTLTTAPSALQVYLAGNGTAGATTAMINPQSLTLTPAFFLYAPNSDVKISFLTFDGYIVGHNVALNAKCVLSVLGVCLSGTDVITQDLNLYNLPLGSAVGMFGQQQYVQCPGYIPDPTTPTADC